MKENKSPNEELEQAKQESEEEQENRKLQRCGYIGATVIALLIILGIAWQAGGKTISETWKEPESQKKTENAGKKDKKEEETATDGAIQIVADSLGEPVRVVSEAAIGAQMKRDELLAQQAAASEAEEAARKQAEQEAADKARAEAEAKARAEAEAKRAAQAQQEPADSAPESGGGSQDASYIPPTSKPAETVNFSGYIDEVIRLVNAERANADLPPLSKNAGACQAADVRAFEIGSSFSHTRPDGRTCFTALDELGISYTACGENIAAGHPTPEAVVQGWMNSPGHRANILDESFEEIGIGVENVNGTMYWVQLFLRVNW